MRFFIGMIVGAVLMGGLSASGITLDDVIQRSKTTATGLAKSAGATAQEMEYDACVKEHLSRTECYQKLPQSICANHIKKDCGVDPRSK